ncbi:YoaK family protein [Halomonas beimenensis]|uniref:Putative membrane protein n=1 Tax=Halomonas beimenensis TaxID=475662 RepID=A0A291P6F0_9GAMM|nr:YoaK family protein [Halomonas beimenensis]ATJ82460.1 putative membrane protein [Halomonas beimenensis]
MISKLPRWVEYGAFVLAFTAGSVNAVGLLGFEHQAISHLSGTATLLGTGLAHGSLTHSLHLAGILIGFLAGAALSGLLLPSSSLRLGRHYETLLAIEGVLLLAAIHFLENGDYIGHYVASMACGLQNALVTTYSGAVVRTTHLTGIVTDLGLMLGSAIRGRAFDRRKALLFLIIVSGFLAGGVIGAWLFAWLHFAALAIPAGISFLLALAYRLYRSRRHLG